MTDRVYRTDDPIPLEKGEEAPDRSTSCDRCGQERDSGGVCMDRCDQTPVDRPPPVGRMGA